MQNSRLKTQSQKGRGTILSEKLALTWLKAEEEIYEPSESHKAILAKAAAARKSRRNDSEDDNSLSSLSISTISEKALETVPLGQDVLSTYVRVEAKVVDSKPHHAAMIAAASKELSKRRKANESFDNDNSIRISTERPMSNVSEKKSEYSPAFQKGNLDQNMVESRTDNSFGDSSKDDPNSENNRTTVVAAEVVSLDQNLKLNAILANSDVFEADGDFYVCFQERLFHFSIIVSEWREEVDRDIKSTSCVVSARRLRESVFDNLEFDGCPLVRKFINLVQQCA